MEPKVIWGWFSSIFSHFDWTDGCIAVSNADMQQIWARVPTGIAITIAP
ncbi:L,D-transpeptidase family protein [Gibbsiella dentisursi]